MRANLFVIGASFLVVTAFGAEPSAPALLPVPQKMEVKKGEFLLGTDSRLDTDPASTATGDYLAAKLRASTGYQLAVDANSGQHKGNIQLTTRDAKAELGPEGYELDVTPDGVSIKAPTQAGLFYGVQTLLQLFPPQIFSTNTIKNVAWEIPYSVHIEDQPRFRWRGFMLDCARHFFAKDDVKRVLDEMALHKLNTFHWHLTDDQGWRIEIKKYPKLTEVGAWRTKAALVPYDNAGDQGNDHPAWSAAPASTIGADGRYGGFYTQDEVREVVAYAAARHITVIPEIEMPGHSVAALAAYPELSCVDGHFSTDINAGVNHGVFCVGNPKVIQFLDDVLMEVFQLFPAKYVHIGGDEVDRKAKSDTWGKDPACLAIMKEHNYTNLDQLQGWFTGQMGKFISEHGKTLVGWSEITEAELPKDAVVMDWIGGAVQAATNGDDVVMSPTKFSYLDYYQSIDTGGEPRAIGGFLPLDQVYSFEPIPAGLPPQYQAHILGAQANLWTEYIPSLAHVEYMAFPRLCALAEIDWSPKSARKWNDFTQRLQVHEKRLEELGINYRRDLSVGIGGWEWNRAVSETNSASTNLTFDITSYVKTPGQYRIGFHYMDGSGLMIHSVSLLEDGKELVKDAHAGFASKHPSKPFYVLNLPAVKENAKYTVQASVEQGKSFGTVVLSQPRQQ